MRSRARDDTVAKQLFSSPKKQNDLTPEQLKRRAIHPDEAPGFIAVMCFLVLVVGAAVAVPVLLAGGLPAVQNVWDLIGGCSHVTYTPPDWLNYDGQRILGWVGALPVAVVSGTLFGLLTYLCMFYDSNDPGSFPPSPVTPHHGSNGPRSPPAMPSALALGYRMVPINAIAFSIIMLLLLRLCLNLPLY